MLKRIEGAKESVGKLAIQLLKLSGYFVMAVTSTESGIDAVKARGADLVFTNSDPEVVSKIRATETEICYTFDTVMKMDTIDKISECLRKPAKLSTAVKYLGGPCAETDIVPVLSGEFMGKTMSGAPSVAGEELRSWL